MAAGGGRMQRSAVLLGALVTVTLAVNYLIAFRGCGEPPSQIPPGDPTRRVYLLTTWRSGSSLVGELFNQHPDVFYHFEPAWHAWQALYPGDAESLQGAVRDVLRGLYRCDLSVLQLYHPRPAKGGADEALTTRDLFYASRNKVVCSRPQCPACHKDRVEMVNEDICKRDCPPQSLERLQAECPKYGAVVIKGVRILDLGVLQPLIEELGLKVVHLVRDPRAVGSSRLRSRHGLIRENLQVLRRLHERRQPPVARLPPDLNAVGALEVLCAGLNRSLALARRPPYRDNYLLLRFEDLLARPLHSLRRLYAFAGLRVTRELEGFLLGLSGGRRHNQSEPFAVSARDAGLVASGWRGQLGMETVEKVQGFCGGAMRQLGYQMVKDRAQLLDMNVSLLSEPLV
uniref:carbohydrate sulfotransferase 2-like n=1 Tax=Pristiophorus japonicus TaxID=55135 RepID=UPI00398F5EDD